MRFPDIKIRKPKWAQLGIADELKGMKVGEIILFPIPKYNYQSIRSSPSTSAVDKLLEGWRWSTSLDRKNKSVAVLRVT